MIFLGEKIVEQMKQVKEERRHLERIREVLLKKVEKLFEQNKLKRYHGTVNYIPLNFYRINFGIIYN